MICAELRPPRLEVGGIMSMAEVGERVAALSAQLSGLEKYTHERWHQLTNSLQLLMRLPEQMARDIGKMEGKFNSEIRAVERTVERAVTDSVTKAIEPINKEITELKVHVSALQTDVSELKEHRGEHHGGRNAVQWIVQLLFPAISAIAAAIAVAYRH